MKTNAPKGLRSAHRVGGAAFAVAALFLLGGCTGGGDPIVTETPTPTLTGSPSPSASPSPTPLTDAELLALMPADAAFPDVRGAIATAKFFTEQFALVFQTGDARVLASLSSPECTFCAEVLADASREREVGDYETGGDLVPTMSDVRANESQTDGFTYVDFRYTQSSVTLHHADGSVDPPQAGHAGRIYFRLTTVGAIWKVLGAEVQVED